MHYNKTYKINMFNTITSLIFIVFYGIMFFKTNERNESFFLLPLLFPGILILILICINIYFIVKTEFNTVKQEMLLILISVFTFFISGFIQLGLNKYFIRNIAYLEQYDPYQYLKKNIKWSIGLHITVIFFVIIYSILDAKSTNDYSSPLAISSQTSSELFLLSLVALVCNYFNILLYATQLENIDRKTKILAMIPIANFSILKTKR